MGIEKKIGVKNAMPNKPYFLAAFTAIIFLKFFSFLHYNQRVNTIVDF